jgi:membrane-associated protease RseP (regulator of RpoE activity)
MVLNRMKGLALALIVSGVGTSSAQRGGVTPGFGAQRGDQAGEGFGARGGPRPLVFGFALECVNCEMNGRGGRLGGGGGGRGMLGVWHYDEFPRIAAVMDGSAAQQAGIQVGDVLLSVDGRSLLSDDGAEHFSELRGGDTTHLTLDRNGKSINVDLILRRQGGRGMRPLSNAAPRNAPDYVTRAQAGPVEIWSSDRVAESTDSTGAKILKIGSTTIRLAGGSPPSPARGGGGRRGGGSPKN